MATSPIYDNSQTTDKVNVFVQQPFLYVPNPDKSEALDNAKLFFGLPGVKNIDADFDVIRSQSKVVYSIQEDNSAVPIEQPVRTSGGGVPVDINGNTCQLAINGSFSLLILDKNNVQKYYFPKVLAKDLLGYSGIIPEESQTYTQGENVVFRKLEATTASFYASTSIDGSEFKGQYLKKDIDYTIIDERTISILSTFDTGTVILGRTLDPMGQTVPIGQSGSPVFLYDTQTEAKASDLNVNDFVILKGRDELGDGMGGSYIVVAAGTGTADGFNFVDLDNGLQLKIKTQFELFKTYGQTQASAEIDSGTLSIDTEQGLIHNVTLSDNVSSIAVSGPLDSTQVIELELQVTQNDTEAKTLTFEIGGQAVKWANGVAPTITSELNAVDLFVLRTNNGGTTWQGFVSGQDLK